MKTLVTILTFVTLTTFISCDCRQNVRGTVIDGQTNQPIQGAIVQKENKDYGQEETDSIGNFSIKSISGGLFGCPPMTVVISKNGYEARTVKITNAGYETIKLQKKTE